MADFGAPAQANYQAPDGLTTLSNLMSLKKTQQGLQAQQLQMQGQASQNQSLAAGATVDTQNAKEKMAGAQLLSDPVGNGLTDENGTPTKDARAKIMAVMPTTGDKNYSDLLTAATNHVQFKSAALKLRGDVKSDLSSRLAGVAADNRNGLPEFHDALDLAKSDYADTPAADDVNAIVRTSKSAIDGAAKQGGVNAARQAIMGISRGGLSNQAITGSGGVAAPENTTIDQGGSVQPVVRAPALAGGLPTNAGPARTKTLAPQMVTYPNDTVDEVGGAKGGPSNGNTSQTAPPSSQGGLPALKAPGRNDPRYAQDQYAKTNEESRQHVQSALADYADPQSGPTAVRYRNNELLRLLPHADTGPGRQMLNDIASAMPGEAGDNYQKVGHYLAQNTAANLGKMGVPHTNEGADITGAATGNLKQNPGALTEITKVNDAVNSAREKYERGLAKATNNGADLSKVPAYKNAFGQNFDLNLFRLEDATRRGDAKEIAAVRDKLGANGLKQLGAKKRVLDSLANTGDLPQ